MDHKDKCKTPVLGRELESYKEKMERSLLGSNNGEVEPVKNEVAAAANNSSLSTIRECDICGKMFNGGKALGGHRRSHFHKSNKKVKVRSPSMNNKSNCTNNDDGDDERTVCCICNKKFPTKSSLCGHMRSHPERSWRGVSPPTLLALKASSSSSLSYSSLNSDSMEKNRHVSDDADGNNGDYDSGRGGGNNAIAPSNPTIDLSKFTSPSWLKKDIRGRDSIGAIEAAETLACICVCVKFFKGDWSDWVAPQNDDEAVLANSAPPLTGQRKRKNIGESSRGNDHEVGKKLKFRGGDDAEKVSLSESDLERILMNMDNDVAVDQQNVDVGVDGVFDDVMKTEETLARVQGHDGDERKMKKVDQKGKSVKKSVVQSRGKDTEFESGNNQEKVAGYTCCTCGKVFSTFQGLGGHRSIHTILKEKNIVTMDGSNDAVAEEINSSTSSNIDKVDDAVLNVGAGEARDQSSGNKALVIFDLNEVPNNNVMED